MTRSEETLDFVGVTEPHAWDTVAAGYSDVLAGPFTPYADVATRLRLHQGAPSLDALWRDLERAHVGLSVARGQLSPAAYESLCTRIRERLHDALGDGPQVVPMPAWLGVGTRA